MRRILVPTDFSLIADNALKYAIEIGAEFKSELFLYHLYYINKVDKDLNFPKDQQPYTKEVVRRMKNTSLRFSHKIKEKDLTMQTYVKEENISSLFKTKVVEHGIDLVVMGSKGATGLTKTIFGSVAATAIGTAKVPVLVVPPNHTFSSLDKIVLAIDHKELSPDVLSPLQKLALKFGSKVTLLNVKTATKRSTEKMADMSIDGVETVYREVPMSKSINETIGQFIQEEGCDLLCMIRREKDIFKSLFQKSITKTQVFSNQAPLLVLPEI